VPKTTPTKVVVENYHDFSIYALDNGLVQIEFKDGVWAFTPSHANRFAQLLIEVAAEAE
jgi:hypothetical protein